LTEARIQLEVAEVADGDHAILHGRLVSLGNNFSAPMNLKCGCNSSAVMAAVLMALR
jgi:hypothetical protein